MPATNAAVLAAIERQFFHADVVEGMVEDVLAAITTTGSDTGRQQIERELEKLAREIERYTEAIAKSDAKLDSLLVALKAREERRARLRHELESLRTGPTMDPRWVEAALRERLDTARDALLARDVSRTRQVLRQVLGGSRLAFAPRATRRGWQYHFTGQGVLDPLAGDVMLRGGAMVAPTGFEPVFGQGHVSANSLA